MVNKMALCSIWLTGDQYSIHSKHTVEVQSRCYLFQEDGLQGWVQFLSHVLQ